MLKQWYLWSLARSYPMTHIHRENQVKATEVISMKHGRSIHEMLWVKVHLQVVSLNNQLGPLLLWGSPCPAYVININNNIGASSNFIVSISDMKSCSNYLINNSVQWLQALQNKTSLRKISLGCQHNKCPNHWLRDCRHIGNQLPMV